MRVLVILVSLSLQGCILRADGYELTEAYAFCSDKGGIDYLKVSNLTKTFVRCVNGEHKFTED